MVYYQKSQSTGPYSGRIRHYGHRRQHLGIVLASLCISIAQSNRSRPVSFCTWTNTCFSHFNEAFGTTLSRNLEYGSGCTLKTGKVSNLGLRYRTALPLGDMSTLSSALQAVVRTSQDSFLSKDRGSVRAGNDKTFDSRAEHFIDWLQRHEYTIESLASHPPRSEVPISVIGAYLRCVNEGDSCRKQANLSQDTL